VAVCHSPFAALGDPAILGGWIGVPLLLLYVAYTAVQYAIS
jgi:hypothetical protein